MTLKNAHKSEIEAIIQVICETTHPRRKRRLADMFMDAPDPESWPEYYEIIPNPRSINSVKASLANKKYRNAAQVYEDLNLVFLNALFYNEEESQIAKDASTLKIVLDKEWRARTTLPSPPEALPASSAQVKHGVPLPAPPTATTTAATPQATTPSSPSRPSTKAQPLASPERAMSPELDVDVGGTPEPDNMAQDTALDSESDAIVQQLERSLPRWEGFEEVGWSQDIPQERFLPILQALRNHRDASGARPATYLESLPEETNIAGTPYTKPCSLSLIEQRIGEGHYSSSADFDKEMSVFFLKARRAYEPGSDGYGKVLLLQRLYQAIVSPDAPAGPPYTSSTNFAGLPAAPGTARPLHSTDAEGVPGITTFRISVRDRKFVDKVVYKGWTVRLADWVHLSSCDDPSRPIIAQVFRCWTSEEPAKKGRPYVTVCWYFRPEQTFHPAHRQFWEHEVFKTSHFADHPLEDLIEKIACQFTARHIRGRPRPPYWYPGWPLYVCDSRYNDRERIFVKIKNWNSCVPEEVRKSAEFMPIYPFERSVYPRRYASPFVTGEPIKAPGGIGDVLERTEGEKHEGGGIGRRRPRKGAPSGNIPTSSRSEVTDRYGQTKGLYVGPPVPGTSTNTHFNPPPVIAPVDRAPSTQQRLADNRSRSILSAAGNLGGNVVVDRLPPETARRFDRDPETNEVLWFAAPPIDVARPTGPQYSLEYLSFLAKKRKHKESNIQMDVDTSADDSSVRKRSRAQPTVTEQVANLLTELGINLPTSS